MKILMLTNNNGQINHHCSVLYNLLTVRVYYCWIIIASDNEMIIIDIYRYDKWKVIVKNGKWWMWNDDRWWIIDVEWWRNYDDIGGEVMITGNE